MRGIQGRHECQLLLGRQRRIPKDSGGRRAEQGIVLGVDQFSQQEKPGVAERLLIARMHDFHGGDTQRRWQVLVIDERIEIAGNLRDFMAQRGGNGEPLGLGIPFQ